MTMLISRRTALASLASLVMADDAFARTGVRVSAVRVNVSALRASGAHIFADWVAESLPGELRRSLARHWAAGGGETVVAQIDAIQVGVIVARGSMNRGRGGSNSRTDSIDGTVSLLDASGRRIRHAHLFTTRPANSSGTITEHARRLSIVGLCERFAHWTPGRLGL